MSKRPASYNNDEKDETKGRPWKLAKRGDPNIDYDNDEGELSEELSEDEVDRYVRRAMERDDAEDEVRREMEREAVAAGVFMPRYQAALARMRDFANLRDVEMKRREEIDRLERERLDNLETRVEAGFKKTLELLEVGTVHEIKVFLADKNLCDMGFFVPREEWKILHPNGFNRCWPQTPAMRAAWGPDTPARRKPVSQLILNSFRKTELRELGHFLRSIKCLDDELDIDDRNKLMQHKTEPDYIVRVGLLGLLPTSKLTTQKYGTVIKMGNRKILATDVKMTLLQHYVSTHAVATVKALCDHDIKLSDPPIQFSKGGKEYNFTAIDLCQSATNRKVMAPLLARMALLDD